MEDSRPNQNHLNCQPSRSVSAQHSRTETVVENPSAAEESPPVLTLRLQQPERSEHKVKWTSDTVDNEFMGKKKSKCCCIYEKPKVFGESDTSSSEDDGDDGCTPHCRGHKKKCYRHGKKGHHHDDSGGGHDESGHDHDHHHGGRDEDGAGPSGCSNNDTVCCPQTDGYF